MKGREGSIFSRVERYYQEYGLRAKGLKPELNTFRKSLEKFSGKEG